MRKKIKELENPPSPRLATMQLSSFDAELQQSRQLDFESKILNGQRKPKTNCLTDTRASAKSFINSNFAKYQKLHLLPLVKPLNLRLANGMIGGQITHVARVMLAIGDHLDELFCLVIPLAKFDIILGMP